MASAQCSNTIDSVPPLPEYGGYITLNNDGKQGQKIKLSELHEYLVYFRSKKEYYASGTGLMTIDLNHFFIDKIDENAPGNKREFFSLVSRLLVDDCLVDIEKTVLEVNRACFNNNLSFSEETVEIDRNGVVSSITPTEPLMQLTDRQMKKLNIHCVQHTTLRTYHLVSDEKVDTKICSMNLKRLLLGMPVTTETADETDKYFARYQARAIELDFGRVRELQSSTHYIPPAYNPDFDSQEGSVIPPLTQDVQPTATLPPNDDNTPDQEPPAYFPPTDSDGDFYRIYQRGLQQQQQKQQQQQQQRRSWKDNCVIS